MAPPALARNAYVTAAGRAPDPCRRAAWPIATGGSTRGADGGSGPSLPSSGTLWRARNGTRPRRHGAAVRGTRQAWLLHRRAEDGIAGIAERAAAAPGPGLPAARSPAPRP